MEKAVFDLKIYPEKPGVYLMKDASGKVLYVGKAKNLKNRLRQYFSLTDTRAMIPHLLAKVEAIETFLCFSEKEALMLEHTLIGKHQPRYNALLKDDKSFICLFIDPKEAWPKLELVRSKEGGKKKGLYFGPYNQTESARVAYKVLSEHFGLRQCSDHEFKSRKRPCLLYGMKKCLAPCKDLCSLETYKKATTDLIDFLEGENTSLLEELKTKIAEASEALEFEKAAALYKTLKQLETVLLSKQMMIRIDKQDRDIFHLYQEGPHGVLVKLLYREGKITGQEIMRFDETLDEGAELFTTLLLQHYLHHTPAHEILCPLLPDEKEALEELIYETHKIKTHILCPQKGEKKSLLDLAYQNAEAHFKQTQNKQMLLLELEKQGKLFHFPSIIECFDLSNLAGSEPVAVKIRIEQGQIVPASKRLFHIKHAQGSDDYGGMREVLERSLKRAKEDDNLPDLLLIDGGRGQVNVALEVLESLDIASCDVLGICKEMSRHDKGLRLEKLILAHEKEPLHLDKKSPLLFFIQNIRDAAHKAAIQFNRKRQKKRLIQSQLDQIPGIGEVKKKALLKHFGSVEKIAYATHEQLIEVAGIRSKEADAIISFFQTSKS